MESETQTGTSKREKAQTVKQLLEAGHKLKNLLKAACPAKPACCCEPKSGDAVFERNRSVSELIRQIFFSHKGQYGAGKICAELKNRGFPVNLKRARRLMRLMNLKGKRPKEKHRSCRGAREKEPSISSAGILKPMLL